MQKAAKVQRKIFTVSDETLLKDKKLKISQAPWWQNVKK